MLLRQFAVSILLSVYYVFKYFWQLLSAALRPAWAARSWVRAPPDDTPWWEVPPLNSEPSSMTLPSEAAAQAVSKCSNCGSTSTFRCSLCKSMRYCTKECQKEHWVSGGHKQECPSLKAKLQANEKDPRLVSTSVGKKKEEPDEIAPIPKQVLFEYAKFLHYFTYMGEDGEGDTKPPVGLTNCGNTCFANSLLQCLMRTRPLVTYLMQRQHSPTCSKPHPNEWCVVCEMENLVVQAQGGSSGKAINPRAITRNVKKIAPHFTLGRQEDSHDLFINMVDKMESAMLHEAGGRQAFDVRTRETTLLGHTFNGYVRYQTICSSCGHASRRFDTKVGLEIQLTKGVTSVKSGLDAFFEEEVLDADNQYKCDRCKERVCARRVSHIEVAPNVLAITLKRFGLGRYGKITKMVSYQEELELNEYKAHDAIDHHDASYRLYGVLVHIDSMSSTMFGHYVSYVRADDDTWYLCDDSHVTQVDVEEAMSQKAYMLFYLRQQAHPAPDPAMASQLPQPTSNGMPPPQARPQAKPTAHTDPEPAVASQLPQPLSNGMPPPQARPQAKPTDHPDPEPAVASQLPQPTSNGMPPPQARPQAKPTVHPDPDPAVASQLPQPTSNGMPPPQARPQAKPTPQPTSNSTAPPTKSRKTRIPIEMEDDDTEKMVHLGGGYGRGRAGSGGAQRILIEIEDDDDDDDTEEGAHQGGGYGRGQAGSEGAQRGRGAEELHANVTIGSNGNSSVGTNGTNESGTTSGTISTNGNGTSGGTSGTNGNGTTSGTINSNGNGTTGSSRNKVNGHVSASVSREPSQQSSRDVGVLDGIESNAGVASPSVIPDAQAVSGSRLPGVGIPCVIPNMQAVAGSCPPGGDSPCVIPSTQAIAGCSLPELSWRLHHRPVSSTLATDKPAGSNAPNVDEHSLCACIYVNLPSKVAVSEVKVTLEAGPPVVAALLVPGFAQARVPLLQPFTNASLSSMHASAGVAGMEELLIPIGDHSCRMTKGQLKIMVDLAPKPGVSKSQLAAWLPSGLLTGGGEGGASSHSSHSHVSEKEGETQQQQQQRWDALGLVKPTNHSNHSATAAPAAAVSSGGGTAPAAVAGVGEGASGPGEGLLEHMVGQEVARELLPPSVLEQQRSSSEREHAEASSSSAAAPGSSAGTLGTGSGRKKPKKKKGKY